MSAVVYYCCHVTLVKKYVKSNINEKLFTITLYILLGNNGDKTQLSTNLYVLT